MTQNYSKLLQLSARLESLYTADTYRFCKLSDNPDVLLAHKCEDFQGELVELRVDSVKPVDKVRFITPRYELLFEVTNLDYVLFDGKRVQVIWYDEYHFAFASEGRAGSVWHICQFAERYNETGDKVKPCK